MMLSPKDPEYVFPGLKTRVDLEYRFQKGQGFQRGIPSEKYHGIQQSLTTPRHPNPTA